MINTMKFILFRKHLANLKLSLQRLIYFMEPKYVGYGQFKKMQMLNDFCFSVVFIVDFRIGYFNSFFTRNTKYCINVCIHLHVRAILQMAEN